MYVRKIYVHIDIPVRFFYVSLAVRNNSVQIKKENQVATARIDMRLDENIKAKAEKAAALLGLRSLTEYIVKLMDDNASKVIAKHSKMVIANDVFDQFMIACMEAEKPNRALLEARDFADEQDVK